jgi:hypothetical protein
MTAAVPPAPLPREAASQAPLPPDYHGAELRPVGGPVSTGWREGTLTRVKELESLCSWVMASHPRENCKVLETAIHLHLEAAKQAAEASRLQPRRLFRPLRNGPLIERAMSNLDAAEAQLLNFAPAGYLLGQIPSILRSVRCHLTQTDPRRQELERIARELGVRDPDHPALHDTNELNRADKAKLIDDERGQIVTALRGASSAALREQVRVRNFRNVLVVATILMTLLAISIAISGWLRPTLIPLCFAPEESGRAMVVCPTAQSKSFPTSSDPAAMKPSDTPQPSTSQPDIDDAIKDTATPLDLLVVELVGLTAAAVAATAAIRGISGSSERHGLPIALAVLKLPTGAITAFLGLLLMRGQFVPGLSALDTSAQILAWALVFGYAQELFTRLVDRQGQSVLDSVRGASKPPAASSPP